MEDAAGIVFGEWTGMTFPDDYEENARGLVYESVADMITAEFLGYLDIPVAFGFPAGHGDVQYSLLMGEKVHLNVTSENYTLEWK